MSSNDQLVHAMSLINSLKKYGKPYQNVMSNLKKSINNSIKNNSYQRRAKIIREGINSIQKEMRRRENILNKITAAQRRIRNIRKNKDKYVINPNGSIMVASRNNINTIQKEIKKLLSML